MANVFTPGDLVISVYGDGDGSGTYTDNQASPIVLEQIDPATGAVVAITGVTNGTLTANGELVLPQSVAAGSGENVISGEYGSSSEGSLELSADGQSLVIGGYGVNAASYNAGESNGNNTYGNAALAQSTSVPGSAYTAVARVAADIRFDGTVDTSTALFNVDNTNNIRSVATVDGTSFYVSGQGVKGDTTQGVFFAQDGASGATAIDTSTDTRTAEIYNGQLYVSRNTSQNSQATISAYGGEPTKATAPTSLAGFGPTVTLTSGQANGVNNGRVGSTVYLAPENFFFANATTLYVADDGKPKNGGAGKAGLGDGGLQKWSYNGTAWVLDYTLSSGLNLVANTASSGTTGLIGLTGTVTGNTVQLYATNATVGDTDQTYLYSITDQLNATTAPSSESFTTLVTAAPDTNIRGVAFAPRAAAVCFCTGVRILTACGEVAVEDLSVGDLAVTASGQHRPVRWIGRQTIECAAHPRPAEVMPVRVQAGALGEGRPSRDLWVSPGHALCLDLLGEVLVPASALVNGATVAQVDVPAVTYWHVELDSHDVLLADGTPAESYIDTGNRLFFGTGEGAPDPERTPASLADYCRPFHDGGAFVAVARAQLRARAEALGWRRALAAPGAVHLLVDGARVEAEAEERAVRFAVPAGARDVWLCSAAAVPMHASDDAHADRRRLGLCVGWLGVDDGRAGLSAVAPGDARLDATGWHAAEPDHRWTAGRARLDPALWAGCRGQFALRVELAQGCVPGWRAPEGLGLSAAPAPRGLRLVA